MLHPRRLPTVLLSLALATTAGAASQSVKLSGPMTPQGYGGAFGAVVADGRTIVYSAAHEAFFRPDLYSTRVDGSGAVVRLSESLDNETRIQGRCVGPTRVGFLAGSGTFRENDLYSTPTLGGQPPLRLTTSSDLSLVFLQPGADVAFVATSDTAPAKIYRVALDGSSPPVLLVDIATARVDTLFPTPRGRDLLFALHLGPGGSQLFRVPADGSGPRVQLSTVAESDGDNFRPLLAPDGRRVVYGSRGALYSVPIDGSSPSVRLDAGSGPALSRDGRWVVYTGTSGQLRRVPLGGGQPLRFGPAFPVARFEFTPDGTAVVLEARVPGQGDVLFLWPFGRASAHQGIGTRVKRRLSQPVIGHPGSVYDWQIVAEERRVLYVSTERRISPELFSVSLDLDGPPRVVSSQNVVISLLRQIPGRHEVVYGVFDGGNNQSLWAAPIDGLGPERRIAANLRDVSRSSLRWLPGAQRLVFLAEDPNYLDSEQLFRVRIDGSAPPERIGATPPVTYSPVLDVSASPDGSLAFYLARQDGANRELYVVPTDGSRPAARLGDLLVPFSFVTQYACAPDGTFVYFTGNREVADVDQLYRARTDDGAPPELLADLPVGDVLGFRLAADGSRIVGRASGRGRHDLWSVPTDASRASVLLTTDQPFGATISTDFDVTSDGRFVLFHRSTVAGLWSVPTSGAALPTRLSTTNDPYLLTPDGTRVAFYGGSGLVVAPVDGSGAPIPLANGVRQTIGGLSANLFYLSFAAPLQDLFSQSLSGTTPIRLNGSVPAVSYVLGPGRIFFRGVEPGQTKNLYVSSIDGTRGPFRLNPFAPAGGGGVSSIVFSESARRVVYDGNVARAGGHDVFSVPFDGSTAPVQLNPSLPALSSATDPKVSADGTTVLFTMNLERTNVRELYAVPIGGGPSVRLNGLMTGSSDVRSFEALSGRRRVLYVADQDIDGIDELYASSF